MSTETAEPVVPAHTVADGDLSLRIQELWKAGRPIHMLVGEEIGRCGTAIQVAAERLTTDRRNSQADAPAVHVVFHDRYCGFYQGLPNVTPCADKKTHILGVALQLALMSKEQIENDDKLADLPLPFRPDDDLIFYFKSISRKELDDSPHVMTLIRNCAQSNMSGLEYVEDKKIGTRGKRLIVFIMPTLSLPEDVPELKPEIMPLPDFDTLRKVAIDVIEPLVEAKKIAPIGEQSIDRITEALCGFTLTDAEEAVSLVWAKHRSFAELDTVIDTIEKEKARIIAKIPGLQYIPKDQVISRVLPGYETFAEWLLARSILPRDAAKEAGIMPLRGFALAGSQGTGKTEICKYAAKLMQRILLIWNVGESKSKFVGDSEKATRQVIQIARATHAFVMLDDIDKGGMAKGKDYAGDGGTGGNQMQMILTEASDLHSQIIWAFTFNRLPDLPELFRPGRLDRCFYVERPNSPTRLGILMEGALRAKRTYDNDSQLRLLAEQTADYSPAELIHVLVKDEIIRTIREDSKTMKVARMLDQTKTYKPQFAIKRFQEDIKEMEEAVSQFHRIGNRPEGDKAEVAGAKTARSRRTTE